MSSQAYFKVNNEDLKLYYYEIAYFYIKKIRIRYENHSTHTWGELVVVLRDAGYIKLFFNYFENFNLQNIPT